MLELKLEFIFYMFILSSQMFSCILLFKVGLEWFILQCTLTMPMFLGSIADLFHAQVCNGDFALRI